MEPASKSKESYTLSPYLVFFLMYVSMVGVGVLDFQRDLSEAAGYNAWISMLLSGISIHVVLWMMCKILHDQPADLMSINCSCFGKMLGSVINFGIIVYFFLGAFVTFRGYMAIVKVWLFPDMNMLPVTILIAVLICYTVSGGLRSVAGLCFWGVVCSFLFVIPLNFLAIPYLHPQNLLPLYERTPAEIYNGFKCMIFQYLGIETLMLYYPLVPSQAKAQKWAQGALLTATIFYLMIVLVTFMFYTQGQLSEIAWPTLHLIMILELPLFQRLEYFVISVLFIKIAANVALTIWAACRGAKQAWNMKMSVSLLAFMIGFIALQIVINEGGRSKQLIEWYSNVGYYFIYVYIPVLFVWVQIRSKLRTRLTGAEPSQ
ncbi:GerAB/ArcD/ProY family transporter [Paenibacillus sp. NPDC056579]|uniref:GerAB/ArcD/ProY family transporter n=1 Tax=Paenibacillus sp. NPDC056579 TaxID=3345871 RepID=UPI0036C395BD